VTFQTPACYAADDDAVQFWVIGVCVMQYAERPNRCRGGAWLCSSKWREVGRRAVRQSCASCAVGGGVWRWLASGG